MDKKQTSRYDYKDVAYLKAPYTVDEKFQVWLLWLTRNASEVH